MFFVLDPLKVYHYICRNRNPGTGLSHPLQKDEVLLARFVNWTGPEGPYVGTEWDE